MTNDGKHRKKDYNKEVFLRYRTTFLSNLNICKRGSNWRLVFYFLKKTFQTFNDLKRDRTTQDRYWFSFFNSKVKYRFCVANKQAFHIGLANNKPKERY